MEHLFSCPNLTVKDQFIVAMELFTGAIDAVSGLYSLVKDDIWFLVFSEVNVFHQH